MAAMASRTEIQTDSMAKSSVRLARQMTLAGGFLDLALFVADVEHLKFILEAGKDNVKYYVLLIILLSASLILQIVVIVLMFFVGFKKPKEIVKNFPVRNVDQLDDGPSPSTSIRNTPQIDNNNEQAKIYNDRINKINHAIVCLVTIIAILNVFITVFGDRSTTQIVKEFNKRLGNGSHSY